MRAPPRSMASGDVGHSVPAGARRVLVASISAAVDTLMCCAALQSGNNYENEYSFLHNHVSKST